MLATAEKRPERQAAGSSESCLRISVVFTSMDATAAALKTASALADRLGGRITLVVPEVVSYQLPLDNPPVLHAWNKTRLCALASECPVETTVRFYLCRDAWQTLAKVLQPHSIVVIGARNCWWLARESRLARKLRRLGHQVIVTEAK